MQRASDAPRGAPLKIAHVWTVTEDADPGSAWVQRRLRSLPGVAGVAVLHSIGLLSVLYDDGRTTAGAIVAALQRMGVGARLG